jgi:phosphoribosyl 1,2-cyclic phosphodiesterase
VYANYGTFIAGEKKMGKLFKFKEFETGDTLTIGDLKIRSFRISHDTADPVGFVISDGQKSVGYCTDTGKVSHLIAQRLKGCNGVILEFNHNPEMLKNGPYPLPLQQRVRSSLGHLSNEDASDFLAQLLENQLDHLVLAHLSEKNNTPELAAKAARRVITDSCGVNMHIAPQDRSLGLIQL